MKTQLNPAINGAPHSAIFEISIADDVTGDCVSFQIIEDLESGHEY